MHTRIRFSRMKPRLGRGCCGLAVSLLIVSCAPGEPENTVLFPSVTGPIAVTSGPKEHLLASYYGIHSHSANHRYVTVLETGVRDRIPAETDTAILGLVDLNDFRFIPVTRTSAWNFQQGCMAHWLAGSPDSLIIYNDVKDGRTVSVILNVFTGSRSILPHPVSAVSPDGRKAVSINFTRLRLTRPDYGYGGDGQDGRLDIPFPEDDGLFLMDLETGVSELLVSIADVRALVPELPQAASEGGTHRVEGKGFQRAIEYFNHTLFSRDGSRIFWLARAIPERNTTALTVMTDGTGLQRCFPDGWGGSHFDWLSGEELMVTAQYEEKVYGHLLFTAGEKKYRRLGKGLLDYDGHGTFSPDGKWMVTDTYPNALGEQKLYLMDMRTEAVLSLGRFIEPPEFTRGWRCDLHPRWSPDGNQIAFNATFTGSRQVYLFKFNSRGEK